MRGFRNMDTHLILQEFKGYKHIFLVNKLLSDPLLDVIKNMNNCRASRFKIREFNVKDIKPQFIYSENVADLLVMIYVRDILVEMFEMKNVSYFAFMDKVNVIKNRLKRFYNCSVDDIEIKIIENNL